MGSNRPGIHGGHGQFGGASGTPRSGQMVGMSAEGMSLKARPNSSYKSNHR